MEQTGRQLNDYSKAYTLQNLFPYSEDFDSWDKTLGGAGSAPTVTSNAAAGPTGAIDADRVQFTAGGVNGSDQSILKETLSLTTSLDHTTRWYFKSFDGSPQTLEFLRDDGIGRAFTLGSEWRQIDLTYAPVNASADWGLILRGSVGATADILIARAQLNEGSSAGVYVETNGAAIDIDNQGNNGGVIHSGGALSFNTNDYVAVGNIGSVQTYSLWVELDTTTEPIIELNASDSLSATTGTLALTGQTGTIYVNGVASSTITTAYSLVTVVLDAAVTADDVNIGDVGGSFSDMSVAEALFYSDDKTAAEVLANYNNPQAPIQDGLVVNYDFNELNGLTLFDKSGNGNNASIVGATWESGISVGYQPALGGFNVGTFEFLDSIVGDSTNLNGPHFRCGNP